MLQGWEIVHRVGFSILEMARDTLMSQDMEGMLKVHVRVCSVCVRVCDTDCGRHAHSVCVRARTRAWVCVRLVRCVKDTQTSQEVVCVSVRLCVCM